MTAEQQQALEALLDHLSAVAEAVREVAEELRILNRRESEAKSS